MKIHSVETAIVLFSMASLIPCAEAADKSLMSVPRDTGIPSRPAIPEDFRPLPAPGAPQVVSMFVVDAVVNFRRVMRRMSFTIFSAGSFTGPDFCLIFAP
jgi:hypothetical protein